MLTGFEALTTSDDYADPEAGYASVIDIASVVVNRVAKNADGLGLSIYCLPP